MKLVSVLVLLCISAVTANNVKELTDSSFEHDTQAASGATTGDWFIEFYAPWCKHCQNLEPTWEQLASELKGVINVAKVDATNNLKSAKRFNIRSFPTLLYLRNGYYYQHSGNRNLASLKEFVNGGWKVAKAEKITPEPSFLEVLLDDINQTANSLMTILQRSPQVVLVIFSSGLVLGSFMTIMVVWSCMGSGSNVNGRQQPRQQPVPAPTAAAAASSTGLVSEAATAETSGKPKQQ